MSTISTRTAADIIGRADQLVSPALRTAVDTLSDRMRLIASYQMGWCDAEGRPAHAGGKGLRGTLAVLSAEAVGGRAEDGVPGAVAVELVHNFSLLHDDVMDRDLERRHRPAGWVAFGEGQAILAGSAMLTLAVDVVGTTAASAGMLAELSASVQRLISGQSDDLALEGAANVDLAVCLAMEAGKTAALMACSACIGAIGAIGAQPDGHADAEPAGRTAVDALRNFGFELGLAFQIVDDLLGISGDPQVTGKSSSDVRAGKRSAPVVAALASGTEAGARLAGLLADGAPQTDDDVRLATKLIEEAGGLSWAAREADQRLDRALGYLAALPNQDAASQLATLARFVVERDR